MPSSARRMRLSMAQPCAMVSTSVKERIFGKMTQFAWFGESFDSFIETEKLE